MAQFPSMFPPTTDNQPAKKPIVPEMGVVGNIDALSKFEALFVKYDMKAIIAASTLGTFGTIGVLFRNAIKSKKTSSTSLYILRLRLAVCSAALLAYIGAWEYENHCLYKYYKHK